MQSSQQHPQHDNPVDAPRHRSYRGQVLVIFAILAPIIIAALGFGIDVAHIYQERRQLQNAVDLAALGGVSQLPDNSSQAQSIALDLANRNGQSGDAVSTVAGFGGDQTKLQVSATRQVDMFFMSVLGFDRVTISARAVAQHEVTRGLAIFAKKDTHCWIQSIYVPGNNIRIDGAAQSNSGMTWNGSSNTLTGSLKYGDTCGSNVRMTGVNPNVPAPQPAPRRDWMFKYKPADFPCTFTVSNPSLTASANNNIWVGNNPGGNQLKDGTICYNGTSTMTLNKNSVRGNVTFRAQRISLSGSNWNLTPFRHGVVIHSTGLDFPTVTLDMSGGTINGLIHNYNSTNGSTQGGQISIDGSSGFTIRGAIISWAVALYGSNWNIISTLDQAYEPMRLVE
jgi:hypothetical protein